MITHEDLQRMKRLDESYVDHVELINEIERLTDAIVRIDRVLRVPAAEYVPAIGDAFKIIDEVTDGNLRDNSPVRCTCGTSGDPGACGHSPSCPLKAIEG